MNFSENFYINKKNNTLLKSLITAVISAFFIFILIFFGPGIRNYFYFFSSPIEKTFWSAGESLAKVFGSLKITGNLAVENENLRDENQKLLSQIAFLQAVNNVNQAQGDALSIGPDRNFKLLIAGVTGLDNQDFLTIDKGAADGILEDMPVINQQNIIFGKIDKVYKNFSKVMLISNKNSIVNVKIQQSEINGAVKGSGRLNAYLDLVPISDEINPGDVLVTSSLENFLPKDFLIGKVIERQKNDQKPFQQAKIELFFDLNSADNLFVVTNYKQTK